MRNGFLLSGGWTLTLNIFLVVRDMESIVAPICRFVLSKLFPYLARSAFRSPFEYLVVNATISSKSVLNVNLNVNVNWNLGHLHTAFISELLLSTCMTVKKRPSRIADVGTYPTSGSDVDVVAFC